MEQPRVAGAARTPAASHQFGGCGGPRGRSGGRSGTARSTASGSATAAGGSGGGAGGGTVTGLASAGGFGGRGFGGRAAPPAAPRTRPRASSDRRSVRRSRPAPRTRRPWSARRSRGDPSPQQRAAVGIAQVDPQGARAVGDDGQPQRAGSRRASQRQHHTRQVRRHRVADLPGRRAAVVRACGQQDRDRGRGREGDEHGAIISGTRRYARQRVRFPTRKSRAPAAS